MADLSMRKRADKKAVIIGDSGVGKTSLIRRFIDRIFILGTPHTIGASFFIKHWNGITVALWDTAGQEDFDGIRTFYSRNAHAVILCYDICRRSTFQSLIDTHSKLFDNVAPNCVVVLVGTKVDMVDQMEDERDNGDNGRKGDIGDCGDKANKGVSARREVSRNEVEELYFAYKKQLKCLDHPNGRLPIFETSSKVDDNVNAVFEYVFETLGQSPTTESGSTHAFEGSIKLTDIREREREVEIKCCS